MVVDMEVDTVFLQFIIVLVLHKCCITSSLGIVLVWYCSALSDWQHGDLCPADDPPHSRRALIAIHCFLLGSDSTRSLGIVLCTIHTMAYYVYIQSTYMCQCGIIQCQAQDVWMDPIQAYMSISHSLIGQSTLPQPLLICPTTREIQWGREKYTYR